jgi:hypothetical protein
VEQCCSDIRSAIHIVVYVFGVSIMFEQTISGSPSLEAIATAKAALDVVDGKVPLSTACSMYNVREQTVIQYIIDKTEYEAMMELMAVKSDTVKTKVKGGEIWSKK